MYCTFGSVYFAFLFKNTHTLFKYTDIDELFSHIFMLLFWETKLCCDKKKISNCFLGLIDFFIEITMRISLEEDSALPTVGSQDT